MTSFISIVIHLFLSSNTFNYSITNYQGDYLANTAYNKMTIDEVGNQRAISCIINDDRMDCHDTIQFTRVRINNRWITTDERFNSMSFSYKYEELNDTIKLNRLDGNVIKLYCFNKGKLTYYKQTVLKDYYGKYTVFDNIFGPYSYRGVMGWDESKQYNIISADFIYDKEDRLEGKIISKEQYYGNDVRIRTYYEYYYYDSKGHLNKVSYKGYGGKDVYDIKYKNNRPFKLISKQNKFTITFGYKNKKLSSIEYKNNDKEAPYTRIIKPITELEINKLFDDILESETSSFYLLLNYSSYFGVNLANLIWL